MLEAVNKLVDQNCGAPEKQPAIKKASEPEKLASASGSEQPAPIATDAKSQPEKAGSLAASEKQVLAATDSKAESDKAAAIPTAKAPAVQMIHPALAITPFPSLRCTASSRSSRGQRCS